MRRYSCIICANFVDDRKPFGFIYIYIYIYLKLHDVIALASIFYYRGAFFHAFNQIYNYILFLECFVLA